MIILLCFLHSAALIAQLWGGGLVFVETRKTLRNVRALRDKLEEAEVIKKEHLKSMNSFPTSVSGYGGGRIDLPKFSAETQVQLADQIGPAAAAERSALREFLEGQFIGDRKSAGIGLGILVIGILLSFAANMISVFA